eukprot:TRINITY_DN7368_c0_g1_i1.p1 TRINITY_DN7368_c0_g1~~TRINITY_DN7368_c0_g1_i1.p1  ORF type:complete len:466 (-),score=58.15 TRINITY_DN7368_c0_g1_i1:521-1918(-)
MQAYADDFPPLSCTSKAKSADAQKRNHKKTGHPQCAEEQQDTPAQWEASCEQDKHEKGSIQDKNTNTPQGDHGSPALHAERTKEPYVTSLATPLSGDVRGQPLQPLRRRWGPPSEPSIGTSEQHQSCPKDPPASVTQDRGTRDSDRCSSGTPLGGSVASCGGGRGRGVAEREFCFSSDNGRGISNKSGGDISWRVGESSSGFSSRVGGDASWNVGFGRNQGNVSSNFGGRADVGSKGGRKGKGAIPRQVRISKRLCEVLRHTASDLDIHIRSDGFCRLEAILDLPSLIELECTVDDVIKCVKNSDKQRFELAEYWGTQWIRAVQGHSMRVVEDEKSLERLHADDANLPQVCVHGTYVTYKDSILLKGLLAGGTRGKGFRKHVHFAPKAPHDKTVISGVRYDCDIAVYIDLRRALMDGVPFYISANQVILSPGVNGVVAPEYILKITDISSGAQLYEQDSESRRQP